MDNQPASGRQQLRHQLQDKALWLYIILTLLLGFSYSAINPIHEGTDELRHYRFVQYIIQNKSLPVQGEEECRSQSHHPPLFYLMASAVSFWVDTGEGVCVNAQPNPFWGYRQWEVGTDNKNQYLHQPNEAFPWRGQTLAAHLSRAVNVLLAAAAVAVTWITARLIWPKNRWMAFGAVPLMAFLPQYLYMAGTLNNDIIAALAGACVCLVGVMLINRPGVLNNPLKWGIIFGAVYSLALMSKFNLAPFGLPLGLVIIYKTLFRPSAFIPNPSPILGRREPEGLRAFLIAGFAFVGSTAVLAGWWFLRNQLLYGEPTGFRILTELWGVREANSSWGLLWIELPGIWSSFVGRFGFGQIPLPNPFYQLSWGLTVFATLGITFYIFWVRYNHKHHGQMTAERDELIAQTPHLLLLGLVAIIAIVVVFAYVLVSPAGAMGRFLFPGLPAFAMLIFWGLTRWTAAVGWHIDRPLAIALNAVMLFVAVWALFGYLQPAYARPEIVASEQASLATFDPFAELLSVTVDKQPVTPGDFVELDLAWRVKDKPLGDFYFFAHLIDTTTGELITQRDTHPATGKFPMHLWQKGDSFSDSIRLQIPETAHPGTADIRIGFYAPAEGYRLAVFDELGNGISDSYQVGTIELVERDGAYPNAQNWSFEQRVRLRGFEYSEREPSAGEPLEITFYWDILDNSTLQHTDIIVLLYQPDGTIVEHKKPFAELIINPHQTGTLIGRHQIDSSDFSGGDLHNVSLILIDPFTGGRVNMVTRRGNWIDDELFLPAIRQKQ